MSMRDGRDAVDLGSAEQQLRGRETTARGWS